MALSPVFEMTGTLSLRLSITLYFLNLILTVIFYTKKINYFAFQGDCWICMELMDTSLDKFYKFICERMQTRIPENILAKITLATVKALNYLKEKLKIIHR